MIVLGVDPGLYGGIAVLADGKLVNACKMPLAQTARAAKPAKVVTDDAGDVVATIRAEKSQKAQIDWAAFHTFLLENAFGGAVGAIERVGGMPGQSATASFTFGFNTGAAYGLLASVCLPVHQVAASRWKGALHVPSDKSGAMKRATELFGAEAAARYWPRRNCDGVAEAAMIALWAQRMLKGAAA